MVDRVSIFVYNGIDENTITTCVRMIQSITMLMYDTLYAMFMHYNALFRKNVRQKSNTCFYVDNTM